MKSRSRVGTADVRSGLGRLVVFFAFFVVGVAPAFAADGRFDHSHKMWNDFLQKYVVVQGHRSSVNYGKAKAEKNELDQYLKTVQALSQSQFDQFSSNEKLAFLINAYNALTIRLILDHYPVKSIKDIGSILKSPWKIKFFALLGEESHLDNIEQDLIRKRFNEPRIHFALVCASKGCPALRNEAFTPEKLEQQFEDAAKNFLNDPEKNRFDAAAKKLEISSIFKWYGEDFIKKYGSVEAYLATRITNNLPDQALIKDKKAGISYLDYDWSINEAK